jgi:hypothetical protein
MTKAIIFVQIQGKPGIIEAEVSVPATATDIYDAIRKQGVEIDKEMVLFVDEAETPEQDAKKPIEGLKQGSRVHVTRCKKIKVTVHFLDKTIDRAFSPGTRVRAVKQWAVREFKINPTDAGEHVLKLCNSTTQPPTDTTLAELVQGHVCDLCFDLVPEKRVEG